MSNAQENAVQDTGEEDILRPPYAYAFEICKVEMNEQGTAASVKVTINKQGHGYGAYVFIYNYCE